MTDILDFHIVATFLQYSCRPFDMDQQFHAPIKLKVDDVSNRVNVLHTSHEGSAVGIIWQDKVAETHFPATTSRCQ